MPFVSQALAEPTSEARPFEAAIGTVFAGARPQPPVEQIVISIAATARRGVRALQRRQLTAVRRGADLDLEAQAAQAGPSGTDVDIALEPRRGERVFAAIESFLVNEAEKPLSPGA